MHFKSLSCILLITALTGVGYGSNLDDEMGEGSSSGVHHFNSIDHIDDIELGQPRIINQASTVRTQQNLTSDEVVKSASSCLKIYYAWGITIKIIVINALDHLQTLATVGTTLCVGLSNMQNIDEVTKNRLTDGAMVCGGLASGIAILKNFTSTSLDAFNNNFNKLNNTQSNQLLIEN